jgi:hypothetical protein
MTARVCRIHDPADVVPGRICGRPLLCREHTISPPDRLNLWWCPKCKACPAIADAFAATAKCARCSTPLARVRYQLAVRRGSRW